MWNWELCQADALQHVRGVEKQQLGGNVSALQEPSLQPSFAKCLCCRIRHARLERLPASSNLKIQSPQAPFSGSENFCAVSNTPTLLGLILYKSAPYTRQRVQDTSATVPMRVHLCSSPQPPLMVAEVTRGQ